MTVPRARGIGSRLQVGTASVLSVLILAAGASAVAQTRPEVPQYGGTLTTSTVHPTISVQTWDPADWNWKNAQDTGPFYEGLMSADLTRAKRLGGKYAFVADAWIPTDAVRGELAESWEWKDNPMRLEVKLRKGIRFPEKPGVMKSRELVADDVVFSYKRMDASPKKIPTYYDHIERVEARDSHTVVFTFKKFSAEWDYRFGWGQYSLIMPKEVADAGASNWKNLNGTGPFMLTAHVQSSQSTYVRNPDYWDSIVIGGQSYKLPFTDRLIYRPMKDEAAQHAALRTGKLDMLQSVRWSSVEELKKNVPQLQWSSHLSMSAPVLAMRVDQKPFDDIRVRRALNMAVNKQEIVKAFYGGQAELLAYPQHPEYQGYYEPMSAMPDSVKELYTYNPDKAKKLLAEAGFPNGFTFTVQVCACSPNTMDLLPMITAYLEKVGVKIVIKPMEVGAFVSTITNKTHATGTIMDMGLTNPTTALRKSFLTGQRWNLSIWSDAEFDKRIDAMYEERDLSKRQQMVREMTKTVLDNAAFIWLPSPYVHSAWWPWVKNYGGELRGAGERAAPIYARIWIDQALKKKMGY